ncbi:MAG: hypothetical protein F6K18_07920 [Okeania sp. SIO2C2]|nr:hypothetical protein [Okeania sp. SIO2C2]
MFYWTIVIALVQKRSLCLAIINVLLLYWTIVIALDPTYILEGLCAEIVPHFKSAVGNLAN